MSSRFDLKKLLLLLRYIVICQNKDRKISDTRIARHRVTAHHTAVRSDQLQLSIPIACQGCVHNSGKAVTMWNPCQVARQDVHSKCPSHKKRTHPKAPIAMHTHPVRAGARFAALATISFVVVLTSGHLFPILAVPRDLFLTYWNVMLSLRSGLCRAADGGFGTLFRQQLLDGLQFGALLC